MKRNNKTSRKKNKITKRVLITLMALNACFLLYGSTAIIDIFCYGGLFFISLLLAKLIRRIYKRRKLAKSGIKKIDKMDGHEFEDYLIAYFKTLGYKAEGTKSSGDYGADVILTSSRYKIAVQAKHREYKTVGVKAVQEVVAAKAYYDTPLGLVVTNSFFTANAKNLAKANNVILWDRETLLSFNKRKQTAKLLRKSIEDIS